ncbi:MAG TPA: pilus assembly protein TadG-related protein [Lacipirellula sp.]
MSIGRKHVCQARQRRGAISVLAAFMSVMVLAMVAFAVDVGYVLSSKQELQRTADSAALAACWEYARGLSQGQTPTAAMTQARTAAVNYASYNSVGGVDPAIDQNLGNSATGDLVFGHMVDLYDPSAPLVTATPNLYNAVRLKVRRDKTLNGETPYFFAKIFGLTGQGLDAEATAGYARSIAGVKTPADGGNIDVLPYALDWETWSHLLSGCASDQWTYNAGTQTISAGADGVKEVNLFPQGTGSPGNRGTVDIGGSNNSTSDIARQIVYGISPGDLSHHGGKLEFDENGELELNGDTGISAGVKDELASIKGKPRLIPIFSTVVGPGNNAQFTIVHWAGIRIMDVKLTGSMSSKRVIVQPCHMVVQGAIASGSLTSSYVYTPVVLVK